jgi:hypothetical protein
MKIFGCHWQLQLVRPHLVRNSYHLRTGWERTALQAMRRQQSRLGRANSRRGDVKWDVSK